MLTIVSRFGILAVLLIASSRPASADAREDIAGVYLFEHGDRRFVLCVPKAGTAAFSVYRSHNGQLTSMTSSYSTPSVTRDTFSVGRQTFRIDEIRRRGWPPRKELTQVRYYDDNYRNVQWRYERVFGL